jgi:hypothetical protein
VVQGIGEVLLRQVRDLVRQVQVLSRSGSGIFKHVLDASASLLSTQNQPLRIAKTKELKFEGDCKETAKELLVHFGNL